MPINTQTVIVFMMLLVILPTVQAAVCFAHSPGKNSGLPLTAAFEPKGIASGDYDALSRLINTAQGFWEGVATETVCKGDVGAPIEEKHEYKVDAHATADYLPVEDTLVLNFQAAWEARTRKTGKPEDFQFFLTRQRLRLDRNIPAGEVQIMKVAKHFLAFYKKTNVRNPSGGVVTQEIVRSYLLTHNSLSVEYLSYSNGLLVSKSVWELHR
ncbi:MAG: hypothetical protein L0Z73_03280 [Gammaproteobacteria bacterium]|nr:hypothetical protein [Gammaproteobacteria bacterium]